MKDVYTQYWIEVILARAVEMRQEDAIIKSKLLHSVEMRPDLTLPQTPLLNFCTQFSSVQASTSGTSRTRPGPMRRTTETGGLSINAICANYIMQYAGSLIGRQFKTIIQIAVFHIHDLVTEDQFTAWKAVGELSALLWVPEIRDLAQYQKDLKTAVANVLDSIAQIDPSKIMTKIKYHLLAHIDFDAIQLGPLIRVATEIFESFNTVFWYCSIYSNHLAPSQDIAIQLGWQEAVKHQLTGGRWLSKSTGDWQVAGAGIRNFIEKHPILQRLVGWTPEKPLTHVCGRLSDILCNQSGVAIVVLELFQILGARHSRYGMPVLAPHDDEITFSILPAKVHYQSCLFSGHKSSEAKETVALKRARAVASSDDDELQRRPRKRRQAQAASCSKALKARTKAAMGAIVSGTTVIGLAAGRSKRTVKRSARALQAEESESSDSEGDEDEDEDEDEEEFNSGDDFPPTPGSESQSPADLPRSRQLEIRAGPSTWIPSRSQLVKAAEDLTWRLPDGTLAVYKKHYEVRFVTASLLRDHIVEERRQCSGVSG
ncbi:hypothetical protein B0H13DRAFT_1884976 [Mycena leptocephala]|nr:hypothetical protein B0H13DRAFT_1884976 [Mycena leptocephala]